MVGGDCLSVSNGMGLKLASEKMSPLLPFILPPWKHQVEGITRALSGRDFAFFFEQGTGKTATTINTLRNLYAREKRPMRTLILCPVVVCENWRREFKEHSKIGYLAHVLKGPGKVRIEEFKAKSATNPPHIFITNFEALQMKELVQLILHWRPEILVVDESQRCKSHKSVRAKTAAAIAKNTKHNFILSGTPITNKELDIFQQFLILDRGATFGDNYWIFQHRYFYDKNAGMLTGKNKQNHFPDLRLREGMGEAINQAIYRKAMRVLKQDCLDLPDLVRVEVPVELSSEQRRLYKEMKRDFIAYLKSGEAVTAQIAVVKALRLQQIVTGYCKTEEGKEISFKENPRLDALADLIADIPETEKIIIWACFKENYEQIAGLLNKMEISHTALHGGVSGKERQKNIDAFQKDNSTRVMIANQAAGGVGVNLTRASTAIFYSRNFNWEQDTQAEARNHRGGSEIHQKITRYDLIARETIDEIIAEALKNKFDMAEKILSIAEKL